MGHVMRAEMFGPDIEVSLNSIEWETVSHGWKETRYFVRVSHIDERRVSSNLVRTDATPDYHAALKTYEEHCRSQAIRLAERALDLTVSPVRRPWRL
jgi:hypothetical protein